MCKPFPHNTLDFNYTTLVVLLLKSHERSVKRVHRHMYDQLNHGTSRVRSMSGQRSEVSLVYKAATINQVSDRPGGSKGALTQHKKRGSGRRLMIGYLNLHFSYTGGDYKLD